jgi:hypothetical protein
MARQVAHLQRHGQANSTAASPAAVVLLFDDRATGEATGEAAGEAAGDLLLVIESARAAPRPLV